MGMLEAGGGWKYIAGDTGIAQVRSGCDIFHSLIAAGTWLGLGPDLSEDFAAFQLGVRIWIPRRDLKPLRRLALVVVVEDSVEEKVSCLFLSHSVSLVKKKQSYFAMTISPRRLQLGYLVPVSVCSCILHEPKPPFSKKSPTTTIKNPYNHNSPP